MNMNDMIGHFNFITTLQNYMTLLLLRNKRRIRQVAPKVSIYLNTHPS